MKKRILASLLSVVMVLTMLPTALAAEGLTPSDGPPQETVCICKSLCTEDTVDSDCPVCAGDFTACGYKEQDDTSLNGMEDELDNDSFIPVTDLNPAPQNDNNTYEVGTADALTEAFTKIAESGAEEATIVLTADVTATGRKATTDAEKQLVGGSNPENVSIAGVVGKHITFTSKEDERHTLGLSVEYLVGDVTFDNITWNKSGDIFANGFLLEFTEDFEGGCHDYVYGGSDRRAVDSAHLIFNAGSFGNPNSSYFVYGGGYAGGMGTATGPSLGLDDEPGMPGWTPPEFEAGIGDVKGDITIEIGGTAHLTALVGGCRNGNVGGDVTITLQADSADDRTVSWLTGAGFANQKGYGHVMGDVTINALSGNIYEIFGTGYGTLPEGCEPGDVNSVAGDVTITVGQESGVPMYLEGTGCNLIGCGFEFSSGNLGNTVCGDVKITLNKTAKMDDGDSNNTYNQSMYGVYSNSTVRGSVTIINNGAEALFNMYGAYNGAHILGAERDYALKMIMNDGHLRKYGGSYGSMYVGYSSGQSVQIDNDVQLEFNGGYTWGIEAERPNYPTLAKINGNVTVTVRGGTIYGSLIGGTQNNALAEGHTATLIFDGYKSEKNTMIPYARNFDEVKVTNESSVIIAAKDGAKQDYTQPFYGDGSVKDLTIDEGATLALAKNASISGDLTVEGTLALPRATGSTTTLTAGGTATGTGTLKPINSTLLSYGLLTWSKPVLNEEYVYAKTDNSDMTLELSQTSDNLFVDRKNSSADGQDVWFINEKQETEQGWYYEVYYEYFDTDTGEQEWTLCADGQGGTALPSKTVTISHETWDGKELDWPELGGTENEKLGTHYVYDPNYPNTDEHSQRLSAPCSEATKDNPLKIYYRAALHDVIYEFDESAPEGANKVLPETKQAPYGSTVEIAEAPTLSGYTFSGWEIKSPTYMEDNDLIGDGVFTMPNEDVTLVGSWTKAEEPPTITIKAVDMGAYTGGESMSGDSFPAPRYIVDAPEGVDLNNITFQYGGKTFQVTEENTPVAISELNEVFIYDEDSVTHDAIADASVKNLFALLAGEEAAAENDVEPGEYQITLENADGITVQGDSAKVEFVPGTLTVRYVSDPERIVNKNDNFSTPALTEAPTAQREDGMAIGVLSEGTEIKTNGIDSLGVLGIEGEAEIHLMFDGLLPAVEGGDGSVREQMLIDRAKALGYTLTEGQYQYKYLDLINAHDGNAWVTSSQGVDVYWPYPAGTDSSYTFYVLLYDDVNREYGIGTMDKLEDQISNSRITKLDGTPTDAGVKFHLNEGDFGPCALVWTKNSSGGDHGGGGGGTTYYTLHYESNGGTEYKDERYARNTVVELDKVPTREGYTFTGWYADKELTERITEIKMTSDKTVYAGWEPTGVPDWLNGKDHFAYVVGYTDGTVRPLNNISRAEVATIFFRLLNEDIREENLTTSNTFADVNEGMWCNTAISTMAKLGVVKGRSPEHFDPDAPITRAEFAAICARFDTSKRDGDSDLTDIAGHWAEAEIERAATLGWIMGYTDGTFRPENYITRAEAMTMINRVLNRLPESEDDLLDGMNVWPDNQPGAWYYLAVQEATNSHDFNRKGDVHEHWTKLTADPDWTKYQ